MIITITPINEFEPTVTGSIADFIGYIYENSPRNTLVKDALGVTAMRIIARDPDQVRPLHLKRKKSFLREKSNAIFATKDLGVTKMSSTRHKIYISVLYESKNRTANQFC